MENKELHKKKWEKPKINIINIVQTKTGENPSVCEGTTGTCLTEGQGS